MDKQFVHSELGTNFLYRNQMNAGDQTLNVEHLLILLFRFQVPENVHTNVQIFFTYCFVRFL